MNRTLVATLVLSSLAAAALSGSANAAGPKQVWKDEHGKAHTVVGTIGQVSGATAEERGLNALEKVNYNFGYDKARFLFQFRNSHQDELGITHSKFDQILNGLPVFGHEMIVHEKDGEVLGVNGDYAPVSSNGIIIKLNGDQAIEKAREHLAYSGEWVRPATTRLGYLIDNNRALLAYEVNIAFRNESTPGNWHVYIDSADGTSVKSFNALALDTDSNTSVTGTGYGVFGSTKPINTTLRLGQYYLEDRSRPMNGILETLTANNANQPATKITDSDNVWFSSSQRAGVDAQIFAGIVYDFFYRTLGRNSYDDQGHTITSVVNYSTLYNNAFWDGSQLVYGSGDGTTFAPLSGSLDIVAHELTHAVTEHTSGLIYYGQSGALNESWSDAMACVIDSDDWLIGEDVYTPTNPSDAMRSLAEPRMYGQPDHMDRFETTTSDNGGVHVNSGIPNKAFYNFASAIGSRTIAGKIWYTAARDYMTASTNFSGARAATLQAAEALFGATSSHYSALKTAWSNVGIN